MSLTAFLISALLGASLQGTSFAREPDGVLVQGKKPLEISAYRHDGATWIPLAQLARALGIPAKESTEGLTLELPEGSVTVILGKRRVLSSMLGTLPLSRAPTRIQKKICLTVDSVSDLLSVSVDYEKAKKRYVVTPMEKLGLKVITKKSTILFENSPSGRERTSTPSWLDDWDVDEKIFFPSVIDFAGGLRSRTSWTPEDERYSSLNTFFLNGGISKTPIEMRGTLDTQNERNLLRQASLEAGTEAFQLRAGDDSLRFFGFGNQVENRRGLSLSSKIGRTSFFGHGSPATLESPLFRGTRRPSSVFGGGVGSNMSLFELEARLYRVMTDADPLTGEKSFVSTFGGATTAFFLPLKNRLSTTIAMSQRTENGASPIIDMAMRAELSTTTKWFSNQLSVEQIGPQFQSFGEAERYQGTETIEVHPVLTVSRFARPYFHFRDTRRISPQNPELPATEEVNLTLGTRWRLMKRISLDTHVSQDVRANRSDRRSYEVSGSWTRGASGFVYARALMYEVAASPLVSGLRSYSGALKIGFPVSDRLFAKVGGEVEVRSGSLDQDKYQRTVNGLELSYLSWDDIWNIRLDARLESQKTGMVSEPTSWLSGGASLGIRLRTFDVQPEFRLKKMTLGQPEAPVHYSIGLRISKDFSLRAVSIKSLVSGLVYADDNNNGRRDPGEVGISDIPVLLDGELNARTDRNGRFEFRELVPGFHQLEIDAWELPGGFTSNSNGFLSVEASRGFAEPVEIGLNRVSVIPKPSPRLRPNEKKKSRAKAWSKGTIKMIEAGQKQDPTAKFIQPPRRKNRLSKVSATETEKSRVRNHATLDGANEMLRAIHSAKLALPPAKKLDETGQILNEARVALDRGEFEKAKKLVQQAKDRIETGRRKMEGETQKPVQRNDSGS